MAPQKVPFSGAAFDCFLNPLATVAISLRLDKQYKRMPTPRLICFGNVQQGISNLGVYW
jgi:hypothetical protein